jgi:hypothetical protein
MSIFSLDLLDNNGVTVSLFSPIASGLTEDETKVLIEHAKAIELICFEVMQRSIVLQENADIARSLVAPDINVGKKKGSSDDSKKSKNTKKTIQKNNTKKQYIV